MAGDSLTQMSLAGHVARDRHHLPIRVQMVIIPVVQVRGMSFVNFRYLDAVFSAPYLILSSGRLADLSDSDRCEIQLHRLLVLSFFFRQSIFPWQKKSTKSVKPEFNANQI